MMMIMVIVMMEGEFPFFFLSSTLSFNVFLMFIDDCSSEAEWTGDVGNVSVSGEKSRVGLASNIRFRLSQPMFQRRRVHRLHQYICQVCSVLYETIFRKIKLSPSMVQSITFGSCKQLKTQILNYRWGCCRLNYFDSSRGSCMFSPWWPLFIIFGAYRHSFFRNLICI